MVRSKIKRVKNATRGSEFPFDQAEGRAHGIGRGSTTIPSTNYYLTAIGTIEEKLCKLLHRRQEVVDQALDGRVLADGFDLLERVVKDILQEAQR